MKKSSTAEQRFWQKVRVTPKCWEWAASIKPNGCGQMGLVKGTTVYAHRFSYEIHKGPIPAGMVVDHLCHNRACVNPMHLRLVTPGENTQNHSGPRRDSKSGIRGVSWHKSGKAWVGQVSVDGVKHRTTLFSDRAEAERAVIELRNRLHTHNDLDRRQSRAASV